MRIYAHLSTFHPLLRNFFFNFPVVERICAYPGFARKGRIQSGDVVWHQITFFSTFSLELLYMLYFYRFQGAPFETYDEGKARRLTHWEQIDAGEMDTGTRKFLTLAPIVLFILASYYSAYHTVHFVINALALALGIIPKVR